MLSLTHEQERVRLLGEVKQIDGTLTDDKVLVGGLADYVGAINPVARCQN